jgi:TolA-binding protein
VIRTSLVLLALVASLCASSASAQSFTDPKGVTDLTVVPAQLFRQFHDQAQEAAARGDWDLAEAKYAKALAQDVPRAEKRDALLELGRLLEEKQKQTTKAAAIYEQFLSLYPQDSECPEVDLRLGRIYREMGSFRTALNKFYDVLYAALRVKNGEEYKGTALRAQLEIASTYFASGDYEQAGRFYSRLKLLELPESDRRDVAFRAAYILYLAKDYAAALTAEQAFLKRYPECSLAPESQYLLVQSLKGLDRKEEALQETLKLLRSGAKFGREHPGVWAYWQQKTGNDLANELYGKGDYLHALTIYQTLAEISDKPEWRWPAVYQIGLCFERLRYTDRALQAYKYIADHPVPAAPPATKNAGDTNLATLHDMAQWRADHIRWLQQTEGELVPLLGKLAAEPPPQVALNARPQPTPMADVKSSSSSSDAAPRSTPPEAISTGL